LEGFGVYIYQNAFSENKLIRNHYRGLFKFGEREGLGVHFYSDGSFYIGNWKRNAKHGEAVFVDNFGEKFEMMFDQNRRISENRMLGTKQVNKRLGFVLDLKQVLKGDKERAKKVVNFILNSKKVLKQLFRVGLKEFMEETEDSRKLTVRGMVKLLQKFKIFNRKTGNNIIEWIVKQSEHNFVFTAYTKKNIEVPFYF
jgi:hypothetical protein